MTLPDREYDPDDNFGNSGEDGLDIDPEAMTSEALAWQWLLLVNPGDEETALRQFAAYRDAADEDDLAENMPIQQLIEIIDWTSGFHVEASDTAALIDSLQQLVARWNLQIDWGVDDADDEDFLAATDVPALLSTAHDRLREHGYALWTCTLGDGMEAGWITLVQDEDAMRLLAAELGIDMRAANELS
ncbi:MAG: hypothetical protein M3Q13_01590 [Pseudomonadota bacterium]|nr:hypothetical protein [Pseudomonadota bacterium]